VARYVSDMHFDKTSRVFSSMILRNSAIELPAIQKRSYLVTKNTSRVILLNKDALQMKKDSKFTQYVEWAIMLVLVIGAVRLFQIVDFTDDLRPASASTRPGPRR